MQDVALSEKAERASAELEMVQAELEYRQAYLQLMRVTGELTTPQAIRNGVASKH